MPDMSLSYSSCTPITGTAQLLAIMNKTFLTTREVAKYLRIDVSYVRDLLHQKVLVGEKVGNMWIIEPESVKEYVEKRVYP